MLLHLIHQLPVIPQLDDPTALQRNPSGCERAGNNKAAGPDGLPVEVFKHEGHHLNGRLHRFIHVLAISTKVAAYNAVRISVLLYGCEAWTHYRRHTKALEAFHIRSVHSIIGIRWWREVPHLSCLTGLTPASWLCSSEYRAIC